MKTKDALLHTETKDCSLLALVINAFIYEPFCSGCSDNKTGRRPFMQDTDRDTCRTARKSQVRVQIIRFSSIHNTKANKYTGLISVGVYGGE